MSSNRESAPQGADTRLGTTSYVVLGLLAAHGPLTPYELKAQVAASVGYFWSFPHSQLYGEPARLSALGLVSERREESGRRRRRFAVTGAGIRAVERWLAEPVESHPQIRDLALLKLYLGGLVPPERVAELARAQQTAHRERLAVYQEIDAALRSAGDSVRHQHATVRLGVAYERAATAFWAEIAEEWGTRDAQPG